MAGLWLIEKKDCTGELIAPLLQGEFLLRLIASEKSLASLLKISSLEDMPLTILVNGTQGFCKSICWNTLRSHIPPKTSLVVYGCKTECEDAFHFDCSRDHLPFVIKDLIHQRGIKTSDPKKVTIDFESRTLLIPGITEKIILSHIEAKVLKVLLSAGETPITRDHLIMQAWEGTVVSRRTIDSHISRLRKKLKSTYLEIEGIYGSGYRILGF